MRDDELTRGQLAAALDRAVDAPKGFSDLDDPFDDIEAEHLPPKRGARENYHPGNRAQVRAKANRPW